MSSGKREQMGTLNSEEPTLPGAEEPAPIPQHQSRRQQRARIGTLFARFLLALLFIGGLFFSVFPLGRAAARSTLLLPALITQSEPAPLVLAGDPVRHTETTINS